MNISNAHNANNFDFIRFVCACSVIIGHSIAVTGNGPIYTSLVTKGQTDLGGIAVYIFFILSGYLIVGSYLRINNVFKYLLYRILRIFPALIFLVIITVFVVGPIVCNQPLKDYFTNHDTYLYLRNIKLQTQFILTGFDTKAPTFSHIVVNGALWTLPIEFACYVLVAILGVLRILNRYTLILLLGLNTILYMNFSTIFQPSPQILLHPFIWHLFSVLSLPLDMWLKLSCYFCAGGCYYFYKSQILFTRKYLVASLIIILISCRVNSSLSITIPVFGTYLLFYLGIHPKIKLYNFAKFGDFSYGIYIYGFLIQQLVVMSYNGHMSNTLNYIISVPLSIIMGAISYHFIERPCMNLKRVIS